MHASGSAVSPRQQHIYPRHPHLRHAGDGDDDLFLVRLAQVQISPIPQRLPAEGFKQRRNRGLSPIIYKMGVLLYDGTETMPLGDGIWAAPLSSLWGT